jgi:hypothetical protein
VTSPARRPGRLLAAAFGLNLGWELAHWPLYDCGPARRRAAITARMAAGDAGLVGAGTAVTGLAAHRAPTPFTPTLLALLGVAAAGVELDARRRGRWSYRPAMPRIGPVGVSPLVQLPLTGWAAHRLASGRAPRPR